MNAKFPRMTPQRSAAGHFRRVQIDRPFRWWLGLFDLYSSRPLEHQAEQRSLQLLRENLTARQREQYERHRYFDVVGGTSGRQYRIHDAHLLNVEEFDITGMQARILCFVPQGKLPSGDILLAQKLALEIFEGEAIAIANEIPAVARRQMRRRRTVSETEFRRRV
jgi:hypothetical protein